MAPRLNHRNAFENDPRFLARLAKQGVSLGGDGVIPHAVTDSPCTRPDTASAKTASSATKRLDKVREANKESRFDRLLYDPGSNALSAFFPGAMLLSLNMMLRLHDAQGTGLKKTWQKRISALTYENKQAYDHWRSFASYPVIIEEIYITGESRLLDPESVCAACKPIIDAFVKNGFLPDDSPEYVSHPIPYTERGSVSGLLIRFRPSPRPWGLIDDDTISHARSMAP